MQRIYCLICEKRLETKYMDCCSRECENIAGMRFKKMAYNKIDKEIIQYKVEGRDIIEYRNGKNYQYTQIVKYDARTLIFTTYKAST